MPSFKKATLNRFVTSIYLQAEKHCCVWLLKRNHKTNTWSILNVGCSSFLTVNMQVNAFTAELLAKRISITLLLTQTEEKIHNSSVVKISMISDLLPIAYFACYWRISREAAPEH